MISEEDKELLANEIKDVMQYMSNICVEHFVNKVEFHRNDGKVCFHLNLEVDPPEEDYEELEDPSFYTLKIQFPKTEDE